MKNLLIIAVMLITVGTYAQREDNLKLQDRKEMRKKMQDLSPEQKAELQTKRLTLRLDLSSAQQKSIKELYLEHAQNHQKMNKSEKDRSKLSQDELYKGYSESLDTRIAIKNKMKTILNDEQFEKWEKSGNKRKMLRHKKAGEKSKNKNKR